MLTNSNIFLFTVRDPIDRLISTYNYLRNDFLNKPRYVVKYAKFYRTCFQNGMNEMMTTLQRNDLTEQSCIDIGKKVLIGNAYYGHAL